MLVYQNHGILALNLKIVACKQLTLLAVMSRATPSGTNAMPIAKKTGSTVPAVMMGCHAGSFCCLNFVSRTATMIFHLNALTNS